MLELIKLTIKSLFLSINLRAMFKYLNQAKRNLERIFHQACSSEELFGQLRSPEKTFSSTILLRVCTFWKSISQVQYSVR